MSNSVQSHICHPPCPIYDCQSQPFHGSWLDLRLIVTNLAGWSRKVMEFSNGRGTAEQWIRDGKYAVKWARLSCHDFMDVVTPPSNE